MAITPNRISLIAHGRYDEAPPSADIYPGMALAEQSDGSVVPHNVAGGGGALLVCEEDALQGKTILSKIASGSGMCPFRRAAKGDVYLMLLQNLQNVAQGAPLMSAGDGTLMAAPSAFLASITAPSSNVTNTTAETTFSNGSYTIPANFLKAGDVVRVRGKVTCAGENSTNTHRIRVYFGATVIADTTAVALAAADAVEYDLRVTVRTVGASGTFVASGTLSVSVSGTWTVTPITVTSTAVDTTAAVVVKVTTTASAASTGNIVRLDEYTVSDERAGGMNSLVYAAEACDNSASTGTSPFNTAKFVRVRVP